MLVSLSSATPVFIQSGILNKEGDYTRIQQIKFILTMAVLAC